MLSVFIYLSFWFCVFEVFQSLNVVMLNLIAPCSDDVPDGDDCVDFDCLSCSECYTPSCFELYPAAAFEAACSCVFRTFGAVYLFVMTVMTVMITTRALLKADACESAFVMHPSDLYLPRCAVGVQ